jgi:gliding motility-associated protein GldM
MAAVATVTEIQSEILKYEATALDTLYKRVHGQTYEVDQLVPMVQSVSNTLVAGQQFEGDLFVAGSASGVNPEMFYAGQPVKVEEKEIGSGIKIKVGKIKFPVRPAGTYDASGKAKASFHVKINLPGAKKPLDQDIEYFVVRPSPQFQSAAASSLYINCGNEQTISIPGLNDISGLNLSVPAAEGSISKLAPGKFVIIPTRPVCNVSVILDGLNIYSQQFKTKDVPVPVARIMYGSQQYSPEVGLPAGTANIRVEPEIIQKDFVENNKKDANYIVQSFTLVVRGSPTPIKGGSVSLAPYNLKPGDSFSITNVKVTRTTYSGAMTEVLGNRMSSVVKIKQ